METPVCGTAKATGGIAKTADCTEIAAGGVTKIADRAEIVIGGVADTAGCTAIVINATANSADKVADGASGGENPAVTVALSPFEGAVFLSLWEKIRGERVAGNFVSRPNLSQREKAFSGTVACIDSHST